MIFAYWVIFSCFFSKEYHQICQAWSGSKLSGIKLGGDRGEIVALGAEISP